VTESKLYSFFSKVGTVEDVKLVRDPVTHISKGVAFVEFESPISVPMAINMSGSVLEGVGIKVVAQYREDPVAQASGIAAVAQAAAARAATSRGSKVAGSGTTPVPLLGAARLAARVTLSNLPLGITYADLRGVFQDIAQIEYAEFVPDQAPGDSSSPPASTAAVIQFFSTLDAETAITALHNCPFGKSGRILQCRPWGLNPNPRGTAIDSASGYVPVLPVAPPPSRMLESLTGDILVSPERAAILRSNPPSKYLVAYGFYSPSDWQPVDAQAIPLCVSDEIARKLGFYPVRVAVSPVVPPPQGAPTGDSPIPIFADPECPTWIELEDEAQAKAVLSVIGNRFYAQRQLVVGYIPAEEFNRVPVRPPR